MTYLSKITIRCPKETVSLSFRVPKLADISEQDIKGASETLIILVNHESLTLSSNIKKRKLHHFGQASVNNFYNMNLKLVILHFEILEIA